MVAFVHNDQRVQLVDDLQERGSVGIFDGRNRGAEGVRGRCQGAVLLFGFQLLLAPTERVVRQNHNAELFGQRGNIKVLPHQKLVFAVHLYTAAEVHINLLPIGVVGIAQCRQCLGKNCFGRNQPDDRLHL